MKNNWKESLAKYQTYQSGLFDLGFKKDIEGILVYSHPDIKIRIGINCFGDGFIFDEVTPTISRTCKKVSLVDVKSLLP